MPIAIVETPGAADANSYESLAEFKTYIGNRLHVPTLVSGATDANMNMALLTATRAIDQILQKYRRLEILPSKMGITKFYVTRPYWTGSPSTTTQALPWPRIGMLDRNGNQIATTVIPQELKDAESEMAILAITTDLTADNAIITQGITDVKAGPVEISFKEYIQKRVLPDAVSLSLIPSWLTDELVEQVPQARFSTLGTRG